MLNYCESTVPYTRVTEHKHFAPWEQHEHTICCRETSRDMRSDDVPFYPRPLASDLALLERYKERARHEHRVTFIGRLGTYRYLDMDACIDQALGVAGRFLSPNESNGGPIR